MGYIFGGNRMEYYSIYDCSMISKNFLGLDQQFYKQSPRK